MNINNYEQLLKTGLHIAMGAANSAFEVLSNPQKWPENISKPPQSIEQILQELAIKGEKTEQEINNFVQQISPNTNKSKTYPKYIPHPNEQCFTQPYNLKNTSIYGFLLEGSLEKLQKLCDKYFNEPAEGKVQYRPATNYVLLTLATIDSLGSRELPDSEKGGCFEEEAIFWVIAVAGQQLGSTFLGERLVCYMPYILVNDSPILVAGREVYGICKEIGYFQIPQPEQEPEFFAVDTLVWKEFNPQTRAQKRRLLEVLRVGEGQENQASYTLNNLDELMTELRKLVFQHGGKLEIPGWSWSLPLNIIESLTYQSATGLCLKQFRDAEDGSLACYQAIVEVLMKMSQYHGGKILSSGDVGGKYEVKFYNAASHPIVEELGLQGFPSQADSVTVPVKLAYWLNFDFTVENGTVIWQA
ncbi:hypothetical protein H6G74_20870 [Nostoc spongiaeforme FACHB-130]|uniref:Uncharacterized protein n=1 Tax=Nostoc spongiaeforme FACHB-130 TaxID=1357510 RepID=A0ABR8G0L4_9NOSO|nr:hypothetical protein [Nostoc spongiaeforme]MBD2596764.1 hypothetical protein [Nostoc spongiaeforme FACHB-130]